MAPSDRSTRLTVALALFLSMAPLLAAQPVAPASLDGYIHASMQQARIPGLALGVVQDDRIVYLKGYGAAGHDSRPVTAQTPFILGSTSKSFTAVAVMQLVEAGKIELDAPVTRYLPWFRTADATASAQITVRHLLHQTSGLRTYDGRRGLSDRDQSDTALERGVRGLSGASLSQAPGNRFEYSNANYNTLGLIVQVVSGISYEDYVRTEIFEPLQMHRSAGALSASSAIGIATGYRHWLGWPVAFDAPFPRRAVPAGYLISSAEDMAHYVVAQLNGGTYGDRRILSAAGITTLHAPGAQLTPEVAYGMGWAIHTTPGSTRIWHDGDLSNFHSHVRLLPEQRRGIIVLMNVGGATNDAAIERLVNGIAGTLGGQPRDAPAVSIWTTAADLTLLVPLIIAVAWAAWSCRSGRRRSGVGLYLPLAIDLACVWGIWVMVPAKLQTPLETIGLFAPDVFAAGLAISVLAVGSATARIVRLHKIQWRRP